MSGGGQDMTVGADDLLQKHRSRLGVAEAFILGKVEPYEQRFVCELVDKVTLETARIRLEAMGLLTGENLTPA